MKINRKNKTNLVDQTSLKVRFSEVDSMQIVWHGNYPKYFEDGRESFGKKYGIGYMDIYKESYLAPIVELNCQYKQSLRYGDTAIVTTTYLFNESAKIEFDFVITREYDSAIIATGSSMQVFLKDNELVLNNPQFYQEWKKKWGIIE
ncbi:MAG: acyl-CoA thioesterase [Marinifilaceae bacterium]